MTDYIRITPEGHIRVTSAAPFDYIVSYVPFPDINKMVGDPIALPNTATVTRKSGKVETLIVNWEPVSTEFTGTFDISGSVGNGAGVVVQRVIVTRLSDLDILRQIRDANPTSQLPALWSEDKDPHTQWGVYDSFNDEYIGAMMGDNPNLVDMPNLPAIRDPNKCYVLYLGALGIDTLAGINMFSELVQVVCTQNNLTELDLKGANSLKFIDCGYNKLDELEVSGLVYVERLLCYNNRLSSIPSLTSKGAITSAYFVHNLLPPDEVARLLAMGFTSAQVLPQDLP